MCNACGFYCCASDEFGGCGCDHCYCSECWPDDREEYEDDFDPIECKTVNVGDELHQILAEALRALPKGQ
jgi:hypothetical protein